MKSASLRSASKALGIPQKIIAKRVAVPRSKRASATRLETLIFGGLWPVKVMKLTPTPRKLKGGATKYRIIPGESVNPKAFMANNTNGAMSVFARKGAPRLPIENITANVGPAINQALDRYVKSAEAKAYYDKTLLSNMDRAIRGSLVRQGLKVT